MTNQLEHSQELEVTCIQKNDKKQEHFLSSGLPSSSVVSVTDLDIGPEPTLVEAEILKL